MVVASRERENPGMTTSTTRLSPHNGPRHDTVDDVAVRVIGARATAPSRLLLEIEIDVQASQARAVTGARARPPSSPPTADDRRQAAGVAFAVLAGFVAVVAVALLTAIVL